jgi:hypothetical protein
MHSRINMRGKRNSTRLSLLLRTRNKGQRRSEDVEMQHDSSHVQLWKERSVTQAMKALFGCSEEDLASWPGIASYCRYLDACFRATFTGAFSPVLRVVEGLEPDSVRGWQAFEKVVKVVVARPDDSSSIEDIFLALTRVVPTMSDDPLLSQVGVESACFVFVFAVICWSSMCLQPDLSVRPSEDQYILKVQQQRDEQAGLKLESVRRPVSAIFRHFQRTMPRTRWQQPVGGVRPELSTNLGVPSLNLATLVTIGKIRLKWVDNITSHLDLDADNRLLSVFRHPSFCALNALRKDSMPPLLLGKVFRLSIGVESD